MTSWLGGTRATVAMILTWTLGWGLGYGGLIEAFIDPDGKIVDVWLTVMALPGFAGGVVFSVLHRVAEAGRPYHQVSLGRSATWGAVTGVLLGVLVAVTRAAGTMSPVAAVSTMTALGAFAGFGSSVFFRLLARAGARRQRAQA